MNLTPFSYQETHRLPQRLDNQTARTSEEKGWTSLFASVQTEASFEGFFPAIKNHLVTITLKQPVRFKGRIGVQEKNIVLPPGSMTLTPAGADLDVCAGVDRGSYETVYLYLRHELLDEIYAEMFGDAEDYALAPCIGVMDAMAQAIADEIRQMLIFPGHADRFYAESLGRTLAVHLLRNHTSGTKAKTGKAPEALRRAMEYIEISLDENLSLTSIAQAADTSTAQLTRAFKKSENCTPYEYVVRTRVDRAKRLLISGETPLAEIAVQCGFSDQPHMNHIVRRATGLTPGAIRKGR